MLVFLTHKCSVTRVGFSEASNLKHLIRTDETILTPTGVAFNSFVPEWLQVLLLVFLLGFVIKNIVAKGVKQFQHEQAAFDKQAQAQATGRLWRESAMADPHRPKGISHDESFHLVRRFAICGHRWCSIGIMTASSPTPPIAQAPQGRSVSPHHPSMSLGMRLQRQAIGIQT